jgi:hypothetical protein
VRAHAYAYSVYKAKPVTAVTAAVFLIFFARHKNEKENAMKKWVDWVDPTTADGDVNHYTNPPFRYCPLVGCPDPVACGQAMSCGVCDTSDRNEARRNGTFHNLPICVKPP